MPIGNGAITGNATYWFQVNMVIRAIDMWRKHGIAMSRNGKPAHLRALATAYTGKAYARSDKGLLAAQTDLVAFVKDKHPDEIVPFSRSPKAADAAEVGRTPNPCPEYHR
jgi:hypothetical protein